MQKSFCGTLLCHSLQTYFPFRAEKNQRGGEDLYSEVNALFPHQQRKVDEASGEESGAQMNYTVCEPLQTSCLYITLDQWVPMHFLKSIWVFKLEKNVTLQEATFLPLPRSNSFDRTGGGREGGKSRQMSENQGVEDRGQGLVTQASNRLAFPFLPHQHNGGHWVYNAFFLQWHLNLLVTELWISPSSWRLVSLTVPFLFWVIRC